MMPGSADILGKVLSDYLTNKSGHPLYVHTSYGGAETYEVEFFFRDYSDMPDLEKYALTVCSGKILDIGAGAGSHALYLQDQGFDVTALDFSPGCVNVMVGRGIRKVMHADAYNLHEGGYNTLLLLMNGIGITGNLQGMVRFLKIADKITLPGAQIIFDSTDVSYAIQENPGKNQYRGEQRYKFKYQGKEGPWFEWLFIDQEKLLEICHRSAWMPQIIYEGSGGQYLARLWK
jgi:SAM-dependent methyltransferase